MPKTEYIFVQPDLEQAEARIVAYDSQCQNLIDIFNDPTRHLHLETAKMMLGYDVKKDTEDYKKVKGVVHGSHYRMTARKLAPLIRVPYKEADKLMEKYHALRPEIRRWHEELKQRIISTGQLCTPFGRRRVFYTALAELTLTGKMSNESWKDACSYIPQATVPDITNTGLLRLWETLDYIRLHHQGHDSFLISVPSDKLAECCPLIEKFLTQPLLFHGRECIIPVDIAVGYNWFLMKKWQGEAKLTRAKWEQWAVPRMPTEAQLGDMLAGLG